MLFIGYHPLIEFIYFQYKEILKALETTKMLAIEFQSYDVMNVLCKYFPNLNHITVSEDCQNLVLAIVDGHQIKAELKLKLEEMSTVSKTSSHPWEILKTQKSIEVSTYVMIIRLASDRKRWVSSHFFTYILTLY